jgi:hypothetical protein
MGQGRGCSTALKRGKASLLAQILEDGSRAVPEPHRESKASKIKAYQPLPLRTCRNFCLFQRLPTEIQVQIIEHAWNAHLANRRHNISITCNHPARQRGIGGKFYDFQQAGTPLLHINWFFRAETLRLAKPLLITTLSHPSQSKRMLFSANTGFLRLRLAFQGATAKDIGMSFDRLDAELRHCVTEVRIELDHDSAENLYKRLIYLESMGKVTWRLDAPRLHRLIIEGLSVKSRKRCVAMPLRLAAHPVNGALVEWR